MQIEIHYIVVKRIFRKLWKFHGTTWDLATKGEMDLWLV